MFLVDWGFINSPARLGWLRLRLLHKTHANKPILLSYISDIEFDMFLSGCDFLSLETFNKLHCSCRKNPAFDYVFCRAMWFVVSLWSDMLVIWAGLCLMNTSINPLNTSPITPISVMKFKTANCRNVQSLPLKSMNMLCRDTLSIMDDRCVEQAMTPANTKACNGWSS